MTKRKRTKGQTPIYKTLQRATRTLLKMGVNPGAPERLAVPAPHVTPVMLLLNDTNII